MENQQRLKAGGCCGMPCCPEDLMDMCDPCKPPASGPPPTPPPPPKPCLPKLVMLNEDTPCSRRNCVIFGGHDAPYFPPFDPKECFGYGRGKFDNSLGYPVGVVAGTVASKAGATNAELLRFGGLMKAFATSYYTRRNEWTPELIDQMIIEGQVLMTDSEGMENPNSQLRPEVYEENEQRITRHFKINDYEFAIELEAPFIHHGPPREYPNIMQHLRPIMRAFFRNYRYGVFWTPNWYLLIWRDRGIYLVLDLNGREKDTLKLNHDGGFPMLIALKSLDNVIYLLKKESYLEATDKFTLREIMVVRLATPDGRSWERDYGGRMSQFDVIATDYAYLKSNLHLTLNPKDALRNRSALPVAVATALASQIDHPATWDMKTYDKIICYGVNMCKNCWEPCIDLNKPLDLDTFPRQIRMGQFVAEILLTPNVYEGWWKCVPMYKYNDFHLMLEKALNENDYVIFQINNQMYSLWKKGDFIYLMDPYRHNIVGRILEEGEDPKSATVRMFGNIDRMLSVFHQILLESNRSAIFHIHTLRIRNITKCPKGTAPELLPPGEEVDIPDYNENIHFDENYDKCLDELGEISDYEEDLASEIEPIEEVSSSEEMVEEEGGEAGPAEGGDEGDEET